MKTIVLTFNVANQLDILDSEYGLFSLASDIFIIYLKRKFQVSNIDLFIADTRFYGIDFDNSHYQNLSYLFESLNVVIDYFIYQNVVYNNKPIFILKHLSSKIEGFFTIDFEIKRIKNDF